MEVTPSQMVAMILDHIGELDNAQNDLATALRTEPHKEHDYRVERGRAWGKAEGRSAAEREDVVNAMTAPFRLERDLAVATSKTLMEQVRNKRQSLSALQSAANSIKEEAAHSRVGPDLEGFMQERYPT